jgi:hypothetical protein
MLFLKMEVIFFAGVILANMIFLFTRSLRKNKLEVHSEISKVLVEETDTYLGIALLADIWCENCVLIWIVCVSDS